MAKLDGALRLERHGDHNPMPCQPQGLAEDCGAVVLVQVLQQMHGQDRINTLVRQGHSGSVGDQRAHVSTQSWLHGIEQTHGPG